MVPRPGLLPMWHLWRVVSQGASVHHHLSSLSVSLSLANSTWPTQITHLLILLPGVVLISRFVMLWITNFFPRLPAGVKPLNQTGSTESLEDWWNNPCTSYHLYTLLLSIYVHSLYCIKHTLAMKLGQNTEHTMATWFCQCLTSLLSLDASHPQQTTCDCTLVFIGSFRAVNTWSLQKSLSEIFC